jgi:hypothetical protein
MTPIQFNTIFEQLGGVMNVRIYTTSTQQFFSGTLTRVKDGVILLESTSGPSSKILIPVGAITAIEISV